MSDENKPLEPKNDAELSEADLDKAAGGVIQQKRVDGSSGGTVGSKWDVSKGSAA